MKTEKKTDVERLFEFLLTGAKIACKDSYRWLRIADLRSRVSDVERMGYRVERERVQGKRYNQYFFKNPKSIKL